MPVAMSLCVWSNDCDARYRQQAFHSASISWFCSSKRASILTCAATKQLNVPVTQRVNSSRADVDEKAVETLSRNRSAAA